MSASSLKPLNQQVVVVTGASSGIGLCTAKLAAERGAKVVLVARSAETLKKLVEQIKNAGGEAIYVVADVADRTMDEGAAQPVDEERQQEDGGGCEPERDPTALRPQLAERGERHRRDCRRPRTAGARDRHGDRGATRGRAAG